MEKDWIEELIYGTKGTQQRRHLQDSPVLLDVWAALARKDAEGRWKTVQVLLEPYKKCNPGELAKVVRAGLEADRKERRGAAGKEAPAVDTRVAFNQSIALTKVTFPELVRVLLPLTRMRAALELMLARVHGSKRLPASDEEREWMTWLHRIVGSILVACSPSEEPGDKGSCRPLTGLSDQQLSEAIRAAFEPAPKETAPKEAAPRAKRSAGGHAPREVLFLVSEDRPVRPAVNRSTQTIKADAGRRVFKIDCDGLAWAVLDSGIDARHPAFGRRDAEGSLVKDWKASRAARSRIVRTYDFTRLQSVFDAAMGLKPDPDAEAAKSAWGLEFTEDARVSLEKALLSGRSIDWGLWEPYLRVPHEATPPPKGTKGPEQDYVFPKHDHGTHVAGILAGDWRAGDVAKEGETLPGVCLDLEIYDLRVLNAQGKGSEFTVLAALQFVRWFNSQSDRQLIHGVNLSLAIPHDVRNYACGRTPVCDEAERLVGAGVVVVAAAGNEGYDERGATGAGGYRGMTITDPGNAAGIITVGATHRTKPHAYGVSYFSSRGPTGDGRAKPDLVAPGEKIRAPVPGGGADEKDGTSMAAPHVCGVAAMLMARHRELVGDPVRIKKILCDTATDLGREPYFQGRGLVDALRALQSV